MKLSWKWLLQKVLEGQKESDKLFMDLEAKRMKVEERMLELDEKRYQEDRAREERQRREEREFHLKLYSMMCGSTRPAYNAMHYTGRSPQASPPPGLPPLSQPQSYHLQPGYPGTSTPQSHCSGSFLGDFEYEEEHYLYLVKYTIISIVDINFNK